MSFPGHCTHGFPCRDLHCCCSLSLLFQTQSCGVILLMGLGQARSVHMVPEIKLSCMWVHQIHDPNKPMCTSKLLHADLMACHGMPATPVLTALQAQRPLNRFVLLVPVLRTGCVVCRYHKAAARQEPGPDWDSREQELSVLAETLRLALEVRPSAGGHRVQGRECSVKGAENLW